MKINPKQFYNILGILGASTVLITLLYLSLKIGDKQVFLLGGMVLYFVVLFISLSSSWFSINLSFVSDLIGVPTSPTYRINENYLGNYIVVKSEVGFTYYKEDILCIFPPLMLLKYKTMVDFENKFEIEGNLEDILKIDLKEFWETKYYELNKEFIESKEAENKNKNQLKEINKEYLNNFNDR